MDNTRLVLTMALCFVVLLLWQAWQRDFGGAGTGSTAPPPPSAESQAPKADMPAVDQQLVAAESSAEGGGTEAAPSHKRVEIETDVFAVSIDLLGGVIEKVALFDYPVSVDEPDKPFIFLDDSPELFFIEQDGLLSESEAPNHHTRYAADQTRYRLRPGQDKLEVALRWQGGGGLQVRKVFTFERGRHAVNVRYEIDNGSGEPWRGRMYGQLQRHAEGKRRGMVYTFTGAALSSPDNRYEKYDFDDLEDEPIDTEITDGWVAVMQHYFVAALLPDRTAPYRYYSKILADKKYAVGLYGPMRVVPAGEHGVLELNLYLGPKTQSVLAALAPGLDLTVDYGVLWFIAKPLFWLLQFMHKLTGNWGWSIILLTVLVKGLFFYPSAIGYRSMAKMRKIQPRLVAIRERYSKDRGRLQQAMMELYKQERINPMSGCLPIVIQIPVFIALYWTLLESVELRQAPFILWLHDLSTPDPYFVLPLIMGATMFAQQKLNPAPVDPVQQKVMRMLPLVFTVMFLWFPSGLVLYWTVSNLLSIAQQWIITRSIEGAEKRA